MNLVIPYKVEAWFISDIKKDMHKLHNLTISFYANLNVRALLFFAKKTEAKIRQSAILSTIA